TTSSTKIPLSPTPLVNPYLQGSYSPLACMDSKSVYCPEDLGSDANENDTPVVPSGPVFRNEVIGDLYVDVRGRPIAEGGFEAVHEVCNGKRECMAFKVPKPTARMDMIRNEAQFMGRLRGHNAARLHGVVEDKRGPCLLMLFYRPRDFYVPLINRAPLPVPEIKFDKQLAAGLRFILEAGIRHCDLKPENVLVAEGMHMKITDFGLSEESSHADNRYARILDARGPEGDAHTDKIGVFSLGIIFYMVFTREQPNITNGNSVIYHPEDYFEGVAPSEDIRNLLDRTLEIDFEHRISVHELANHTFLCRDFCLPDTASDVTLYARTSENNGENSRAWKRKKRRAEKAAVKDREIRVNQEGHATVCVVAAKGKEVVHWCRVDTKSGTETITDADVDATTKGHSVCTRNQGETQKTTGTVTLGAQAYRRYVAKETIKERDWAILFS
ncbi:Serine/threonine-protein kinase plk1, partial [Mortierella hygrophila]